MRSDDSKSCQAEITLSAAYNCIAAQGYANTSLRDIADSAGVVLSQLNYYYKNKEGLFTEVIKMMIKKYRVEMEYRIQIGDTAVERLMSLINYYREVLESNPKIFRLLYDFSSMALWSETFGNLLHNMYDDLANLIEKHILIKDFANTRLAHFAPQSIARMVIGAMFGTAIQVMLNPQNKRITDSLNAIKLVLT